MVFKKIYILIIITFLLVGCTPQTDKIRIAVIVKSTTSQFFKSVQSGSNAASKEYNIDLSYMGPDNEEDYQTQISMIEQAIKDKVDAIVLSSIDYNQLVKPVEKATSQGIPVVIIDSDVNSKKVSARITTDNFKAGQMAGDAVIQLNNKKKKVGIVNFAQYTANGQERENGFRERIKQDPNITNTYTINVLSNTESATQMTKQFLKDYPSINVIVTFNEWTTLGVGYAIEELGLKDTVSVVAFDNNPISVAMLETGDIDALVVQTPFAIGYLGVEEAYHIVTNNKPTSKKRYTKTVVITKENMFYNENQKIVFPID